MPIYEYRCKNCGYKFERFYRTFKIEEVHCPRCGETAEKIISPFFACTEEVSYENTRVEEKIKNYEREGKFSHAAELADKSGLKERAMENYKKAGYEVERWKPKEQKF